MQNHRDEELIYLLRRRDGRRLDVKLKSGSVLPVFNIAWGYDLGEDHAHVTTNCSPFLDDQPVQIFHTHEVESVTDPETGTVLYPSQRQASS